MTRHADDAPCGRCSKDVHLPHDPPCEHGLVACPECGHVAVCPECRKTAELEMYATGEYSAEADPFRNHLAPEPAPHTPTRYGGIPIPDKEQGA